MRAYVFYPLVAAFAALSIALSMGRTILPPSEPAPQAGVAAGESLVFGAAALAHAAPGPAQVAYVDREKGKPAGLQIGSRVAAGAPTPDQPGVRLALTPEATALLAGRPVRADVKIEFMPSNSVSFLAVRLGEGSTAWAAAPIPAEGDALSFTLPANANPTALGLWPYVEQTEDYYEIRSLEVLEVRLTPL